eukprot:358287-Chlamydomonas_euryale.AAC.5
MHQEAGGSAIKGAQGCAQHARPAPGGKLLQAGQRLKGCRLPAQACGPQHPLRQCVHHGRAAAPPPRYAPLQPPHAKASSRSSLQR